MFLEAFKDFSIEPNKSFLVGDRLTDLQSAARANLGMCVHLLTGHGKEERSNINKILSTLRPQQLLRVHL